MTALTCECNDQTQMEFCDAEPLAAIDVSEFVTYMTPEFQADDDDGTDLPLPDIESLIVPAPEPRGRRNRPGTPLRDTVAEVTSESDDQTFGEGLDVGDSVPQSDHSSQTKTESEQPVEETGDQLPEKRKRRRRRRRRGPSDGNTSSDISQRPEVGSEENVEPSGSQISQPQTDGTNDAELSSGESTEKKSAPRKRRRRRRRGPRKATGDDSPSTPSDT